MSGHQRLKSVVKTDAQEARKGFIGTIKIIIVSPYREFAAKNCIVGNVQIKLCFLKTETGTNNVLITIG
jgi:hypothetical protein